MIVRRRNFDKKMDITVLVPREQLFAAKIINVCLLGVSIFWEYTDLISQTVMAFLIVTGFFNLLTYAGYKLRIVPGPSTSDSVLSCLPRIQVDEIDYSRAKNFAYFERWFFSPLTWIIQVILIRPKDQYDALKAQFFLPDEHLLAIIYLFLMAIIYGISRS